jgi:thiol-disulfide isomerase/thioredoxin
VRALRNIIKVLVFFSLFFLVGCEEITTTTTTLTSETISYLDLDYSDFGGQFIYNSEEQLSKPEIEYYIYFYGPFCSACHVLKPEILDRFYRAENDVIYLVAVNYSSDINDDIDIRYTPSLVKVVDGEVVETYQGNTAIREMLGEID